MVQKRKNEGERRTNEKKRMRRKVRGRDKRKVEGEGYIYGN